MLIRFLSLERRYGVILCVLLVVAKVVYIQSWLVLYSRTSYTVLVQFSISIIAMFIDDMVGLIITLVNRK